MKQYLLAFPFLCTSFLSYADMHLTRNIDLIKANSVNTLDISRGIHAKISCTQGQSTMKVTGQKKYVEALTYSYSGHKLIIDGGDKSSFFNNSSVDVTLYLNQKMSGVAARYGVDILMDACALSPSSLSIDLEGGVSMDVSGQTKSVDLRLHRGVTFNKQSHGFNVESADINCNSGCEAHLPGADFVQGTVMAGGELFLSSKTVNQVSTIMGGSIKY